MLPIVLPVCNFGIGLRAYFEFTFSQTDSSSDSTARGDGFTFAIVNGSNNNNSSGGAPIGISEGELLGYAGPGETNGLGLQPPKMAIEFDVYPNLGSGTVCNSNSRIDANDNNHIALMFWGDNLPGTCTISGINYPMARFEDNRHGAGGVSGYSPVNSYNGDGTGGFYSVAKGSNTYNWLEDGQLHRFRIEITRATVTAASGNYTYNVQAWVDCPGCTSSPTSTFQKLTVPYTNLTPQINRTFSLIPADHQAFNTMLFGWTEATGAATQTLGIQNFSIYFPQSSCVYGINPQSASYTNAASSGNTINVLAGSTCAWTAVSNNSWITITSGASGTGNGTVTYNVSANTGIAQTGTMTIAGQTFTVTQANGCPYAFGACPAAFPRAGGTGSVSVTTNTGCTWTSSDNATWISTSPTSSSGSGSVTINVSGGNGGNTPRSGTVTVSGTMGNTKQTSCTITENH
ncbi:MAG: BACON domain-containing protein [Smithella sp.]